MKRLAKLMLLTLGIGVVAVVLLSLPRHTAAAATATPPSLNLLLINGCFVDVLPNGNLSPATGCYLLPQGRILVVTDVIVTVTGGSGPCDEFFALNPNGSLNTLVYSVYINLDALGNGTRHDTFATPLVFSSLPGIASGGSSCAPVGGGFSPPGAVELLGYLL